MLYSKFEYKMYWSLVVVHILIIALISYESFPIDLKEIEHGDIYLVDKQRKGRFIEVNQTTFLPNPIELIRQKKSSMQNKEKSPNKNEVIANDVLGTNKEKKSIQPEINHQKQYNGNILLPQNNYTCSDSLFEPQTFGYPAFVEDHFIAIGQHPDFPNPMHQLFTDNCCHLDKFAGIFARDFSCINDFMVAEENSVC